MANEVAKDVRFRTVTMSVRCDMLTEEKILGMLNKWNKGIKGFAYIKHDKDIYTCSDELESQRNADESLRQLDDMKDELSVDDYETRKKEIAAGIVVAGQHKVDHWHILADFGTNAKPVSDIATVLGIPANLICGVRGKKKGFANMLAYLTHITEKARDDNKHEYLYDEVKGLRFPNDPAYSDFQTYDDFASAFESNSLQLDLTAVMVMQGKITPGELKEKSPEYYLNNIQKIGRARLEYVNSLPTPDTLFNFYVGAMCPSKDGRGGRIGKGLACQVLAVSHLKSMFPNVDFTKMTLDDLRRYIFFAGAEGVTFDGYDGQPIIIWDDVRGFDLVKLFGGVGRLFKALDTHPKPMAFNVKYGKVLLKNRINIFNGIETYQQFITALSQEYKELSNGYKGFQTKEDMSQAQGRFPFFIEVSPEFVTASAQLEYLVGTTKYDFCFTVENHLRSIAQHGMLFQNTDWLGDRYTQVEQIASDGSNYAQPLPSNLFQEVDLKKDYAKFQELWQRVFARDIESGKKKADLMVDFDTWVERGAHNAWDEDRKCFYRR